MESDNLQHWEKFGLSDHECRSFDHWIVAVRQKQVTLGSVVFLLRSARLSLADVSAEEMKELPAVARWFENATRSLYGAQKFNYVAAMMKDPFFHFHAFPRYGMEMERHGVTWTDADWPRAVSLRDVPTSPDVLKRIIDELRRV